MSSLNTMLAQNFSRVAVTNGVQTRLLQMKEAPVSKFQSRPEYQKQRKQFMTPAAYTELTDFVGNEFKVQDFGLE